MFWKKKETKSKYSTDLIKKWEGCKLTAYKCPAGKWTIGYGNTTYEDGSSVKEGDKITQARAEQMLISYLEKEVYWHLERIGLSDSQISAVSSLIYNVGWGSFSRSKCWKAMKEKDWEGVITNWTWYRANGKFLKGLAKRRIDELGVFFKDV